MVPITRWGIDPRFAVQGSWSITLLEDGAAAANLKPFGFYFACLFARTGSILGVPVRKFCSGL